MRPFVIALVAATAVLPGGQNPDVQTPRVPERIKLRQLAAFSFQRRSPQQSPTGARRCSRTPGWTAGGILIVGGSPAGLFSGGPGRLALRGPPFPTPTQRPPDIARPPHLHWHAGTSLRPTITIQAWYWTATLRPTIGASLSPRKRRRMDDAPAGDCPLHGSGTFRPMRQVSKQESTRLTGTQSRSKRPWGCWQPRYRPRGKGVS
jgi:hypothetical protein